MAAEVRQHAACIVVGLYGRPTRPYDAILCNLSSMDPHLQCKRLRGSMFALLDQPLDNSRLYL